MKKNELKPIFNMSYASLMQLGDKTVQLIERDETELENYGVNDALKKEIMLKTEALKEMSSDEELLSEVSLQTSFKNKHAENIRNAIRMIAVRAKNIFGEKSPQYKRFGIKDMDKMNDNDLYRCAKRVVRTAESYLTELSAKGLKQDEIDALTNMAQIFDDSIDTKEQAVRMRDIATEERIRLANELYKLITEVFDYGKTHWHTREESKYNDYVVYESSSSSSKPNISVAPLENYIYKDKEITEITVLKLQNTGKRDLFFYIANSDDASIPENVLLLPPKAKKTVTAESISNGTFGSLIIANQSESQGSFSIQLGK